MPAFAATACTAMLTLHNARYGEHIEKLNTLNTVVREMANILRHRLRVTARINDKTRRHLCKVIAQRLANAAAGRIHQHQIGRFALCGGELGGIQRLEMKAG